MKKFSNLEFEPATSHQFTIDPGDPLRLSEITGMSIEMGDKDLRGQNLLGEFGSVWRPRRIVIELNARTVYETLRLAYPPKPPAPSVGGVSQ